MSEVEPRPENDTPSSWAGELVSPIRDLSKPAVDIIKAIGGPAVKELGQAGGNIVGGLIGDRIHNWRQRNLVSFLERTVNHIQSKGIDLDKARALPDGELYAIFRGASKADEPDVQEMWAALLATALNETEEHVEITRYAATLEQLTGTEARLLDFLSFAERWSNEMSNLLNKRNPLDGGDHLSEVDASIADHRAKLRRQFTEAMADRAEDDLRPIAHLQRLGCATHDVQIKDVNSVLEELDFGSMEGLSFNYSRASTVKAREFEALMNDITTQIRVLSGQIEEYANTMVIDDRNDYKPIRYVLTDYGRNLLIACNTKD